MIKSISGPATNQFVTIGKSKFLGLNENLARQRLAELSSASSLGDFGKLNSVGLYKLTGKLRGFWSIDVHERWRIIFRFRDGNAYEVEICDTHKG